MSTHTSIFVPPTASNAKNPPSQSEVKAYLDELLSRTPPKLPQATQELLTSLRTQKLSTHTPNVSDTTGSFLYHLIRDSGVKHLLELGTANGYSSVYLLEAIGNSKIPSENKTQSGHLLTIEILRDDYERARKNLKPYSEQVTLVRADATDFLKSSSDLKFDFIFIDAQKTATLEHFLLARKLLNPNGIIVVDDVVKFGHKMQDFHDFIKNENIPNHIIMTDSDDGVMVVWGGSE